MSNPQSIQTILEMLPHRYPFVMVDRVELTQRNRSLRAWKRISCNEPCLQGHFPSEKVFPGVLITEACAQASALLIGFSAREDQAEGIDCFIPKQAYLTRINIKIFGKATPGDTLTIDTHLERRDRELFAFSVAARTESSEIAGGTLFLAILRDINAS